MKFYKQLIESIIDIPRKDYAPGVFDNADTENPKLKQKVLDMIDKQIKEFEKLAPVVSTSVNAFKVVIPPASTAITHLVPFHFKIELLVTPDVSTSPKFPRS